MINPTLKTQCEGIYRHIQKYYSLNPLIVFRKKGSLEDRIKSYFDDFGKKYRFYSIENKICGINRQLYVNHLCPILIQPNQSLCIAGSLDENFGKTIGTTTRYPEKTKIPVPMVMGMPTWDNIKGLNKPEYKGIEIIYSTPFYNAKIDKVSSGYH
jgi:hypothetical protein